MLKLAALKVIQVFSRFTILLRCVLYTQSLTGIRCALFSALRSLITGILHNYSTQKRKFVKLFNVREISRMECYATPWPLCRESRNL